MKGETWFDAAVAWCGMALLLLGVIAGGLYAYGWHINPKWGDSIRETIYLRRVDRLRAALSAANGNIKIDDRCFKWEVIGANNTMRYYDVDKNEWEIHSIYFANAVTIKDLSPLRGLPLRSLSLGGCQISDLSVLSDMPLEYLDLSGTLITDLTPLKNMKLQSLSIGRTKVSDLSALRGMPLKELAISATSVTDWTPLTGMRLTTLFANGAEYIDWTILKSMPALWEEQYQMFVVAK